MDEGRDGRRWGIRRGGSTVESSGQFAFQLNSEHYDDDFVAEPLSLAAHLGRSETRELARSLVPAQPIWLFSGRKPSHRASGRH
ncbi:hypothetical protein [Glaciihabitans sp. UYNi722]|uniref:hypothetical protein n=1 Tax=Glaciihabitans sp. UYNi722 TaxID=3156344 RepID=UPI00339973EE